MNKIFHNSLIFIEKSPSKKILKILFLLSLLVLLQLNCPVWGQNFPDLGGLEKTQNFDELGLIAEQYLIEKTKEISGTPEIIITPLKSHQKPPYCPNPIPYMSQGAKLYGKTTVSIRCEAPLWRIMIKAQIKINAPYLTVTNTLSQGHIIDEGDLSLVTGDITALRQGVLTDKNQVIGKTVVRPIQAGSPIWQENIRIPKAIQQGQNVRIISKGSGFFVTSEGYAINSAGIGEVAKAKLENGTIIRGIVKADGVIEINF